MPFVDFLNDGQPSPIDWLGVKFSEPGAKALRDSVCYPEANFIAGLDRILPTVSVLNTYTEDSPNGLLPHCGAVFLAILAVGPWRHQAASSLAVGEEGGCQFSDCFHVE